MRVVEAGMGKLHEVKYEWSLDELLEVSDFLAAKAAIETIYGEAAMSTKGKK